MEEMNLDYGLKSRKNLSQKTYYKCDDEDENEMEANIDSGEDSECYAVSVLGTFRTACVSIV